MEFFKTRLINQIRCWGSYALSVAGVHKVHHLPVFVSVEPANFCQLACPECPVGMKSEGVRVTEDGKKGVMSVEDFRCIVNKVAPFVHTMQLFWQGEPLLNDRLPEMVRIAREAGIYTIISTNAQRLNQSTALALAQAGLNRIIVSMDGWTQASYEQYRRGGSVEQAKQAVRLLRQAKMQTGAHMLIELQCLYLKTNEHEWQIFRREYRHLGADRLTMKTAQIYNYENGSPLMPTDARYARYKWNAHTRTYVLKRKLRNRCYRLWSGCVIDVKGNVLPCCYDKQQAFVLGNILNSNTSLADIWHNKKAAGFRQAVLRRRASIPMCTNCE